LSKNSGQATIYAQLLAVIENCMPEFFQTMRPFVPEFFQPKKPICQNIFRK
jgi:hypothetical protein